MIMSSTPFFANSTASRLYHTPVPASPYHAIVPNMANPVMDVEVALAERVASSIGMAVPKAGRRAITKDAWAEGLRNDWHNAALN
jgi:hypothetical protein